MEECGVVSLKLKVLCTKSVLYLKLYAVNVLCSVERDIDWVSLIICIGYSIYSSGQSHIHNEKVVWMSSL